MAPRSGTDLMRRVPAEHRRLCHNVLSGSNEPGFSQAAWQDWFMYRNLFAGQRSGLYVDIGTNDALAILECMPISVPTAIMAPERG
eukprot:scaffold68831_cov68-Phaeocystis_antarctica.AAC.2